MFILTDNDVVHKLCVCDLLPELLGVLKCPPNEIWVVSTMQFKLRQLLKNDNAALSRLDDFLKKTTNIPVAQTASLDKFADLDVGEKALFAVFLDNSGSAKVITGDKRAIKDVAKICQKDSELAQLLAGKVDCFESIMLNMIEKFGFEAINSKVAPNKSIDIVLGMAFGDSRNEAHATAALYSYIKSLAEEASFIQTDKAS